MRSRTNVLSRALLACLSCLTVSIALNAVPDRSAAESNMMSWSPPVQIYAAAKVGRPRLLADYDGSAHVVWDATSYDAPEGSLAIYYSRCNSTCTSPVDVLIGPDGRDAIYPEVALDPAGRLYATFLSAGRLYLAAVDADRAQDPSAWSPPVDISGISTSIVSPTGLIVSEMGDIRVAFAGQDGVYHSSSSDFGRTWSAASPIYRPPPNTVPHFARLTADRRGRLHVVWSLIPTPDGLPVQGVFAAFSDDEGSSWSSAQQLSGVDYGEPTIVADDQGSVHVAFNARVGIGGKYYTMTSDGGLTWSSPLDVGIRHDGTGLNGHPNVAFDSSGGLHLVGGGNSLWLVERSAQSWGTPADLTRIFSELSGVSLGYSERPDVAVAGGNRLHLVFWDDSGDNERRMWHTTRSLDTPEATVAERVRMPVTAAPSPTQRVSIIASPEPPQMSLSDYSIPVEGQRARGRISPLVVGLAASFTLVVMVIVIVIGQRR